MGLRKRYFFYNTEHYIDADKNLLFFQEKIPFDYYNHIYIFQDTHNNRVSFSDLDTRVLPLKDTYKNIINFFCDYYEFSHRNPLGFNLKNRARIIHLCLNFGYKSINSRTKPSAANLAEVFNITKNSLIGAEKRYKICLKRYHKEFFEMEILAKYISEHILG